MGISGDVNLLTTGHELSAFSSTNFATCRKLLATSCEFLVTSRETFATTCRKNNSQLVAIFSR